MAELLKAADILLGVVLRLGVPLLLTAALVAILRKMDSRWAEEGQLSSEVTETTPDTALLFPKLQCWVARQCPREMIEACPAYREAGRPCWQVFRDGKGRLQDACLICDVFRRAPEVASRI